MQRQSAAIRPWRLWSYHGIEDSTNRCIVRFSPVDECLPGLVGGNVTWISGLGQCGDRIRETLLGDHARIGRLGRDMQWYRKVNVDTGDRRLKKETRLDGGSAPGTEIHCSCVHHRDETQQPMVP